jgi:hypothetical protein
LAANSTPTVKRVRASTFKPNPTKPIIASARSCSSRSPMISSTKSQPINVVFCTIEMHTPFFSSIETSYGCRRWAENLRVSRTVAVVSWTDTRKGKFCQDMCLFNTHEADSLTIRLFTISSATLELDADRLPRNQDLASDHTDSLAHSQHVEEGRLISTRGTQEYSECSRLKQSIYPWHQLDGNLKSTHQQVSADIIQ